MLKKKYEYNQTNNWEMLSYITDKLGFSILLSLEDVKYHAPNIMLLASWNQTI